MAVQQPVTWSGAQSVDMGASWTSDELYIDDKHGYSVDYEWTGASDPPVGVVYLEASNGTGWSQLSESIKYCTVDGIVDGVDGGMWVERSREYKLFRVRYVRTSGGTAETFSATLYSRG